jgi:hypothetical protein
MDKPINGIIAVSSKLNPLMGNKQTEREEIDHQKRASHI